MTVKMGPGSLGLLLGFVGLSIALLEFGSLLEHRGTLLVLLVFWAALAQGAVAVTAIGDLTNARWITSMKRELLSFYPLLLFIAVLFLLVLPIIDLYPWTQRPGRWLNSTFFMARNLFLLLLSYGTARLFARRSLEEDPRKRFFAGVYLLVFVTSQTLVAFDWVMSLSYPWYSTLFGAYFFVEAVYAGLALTGILAFLCRRELTGFTSRYQADLGTLIFGFSILWAGLFFAQFLLLWYGNLPEETGYIVQRISASPLREMAFFFIAANFLAPFLVLMTYRGKRNIHVVCAISVIILAGLFFERLFFIIPHVTLHGGVLVVENVLIFSALLMMVHSREMLLKGDAQKP
jgi:hypothetical protein